MFSPTYRRVAIGLVAAFIVFDLGLMFLPLWAAAAITCVILGTLLMFLPVVIVTGIVYGSGNMRTFFIGGGTSAVIPYLIAIFSLFPSWDYFYYGFGRGRGPIGQDLFGLLIFIWVSGSPCIWGLVGGFAAMKLRRRIEQWQGRIVLIQFGLKTLMLGMTGIAVYFAMMCAMPIFIVGPPFTLAIAAVPAALVTGIVYGRRQARAFFIGALTSAALPVVLSGGYLLVSSFRWDDMMNNAWGSYGYQDIEMRIAYSFALLGPFLPLFIGGFLARAMRQRLQPEMPATVGPMESDVAA
jgi:hypothetical protein